MRISNPFRYQFLEPARSTSCILKLWFGKKYLIMKAKSATQTVNALSLELDRRLRLGVAPGHMYEKVVRYILKSRVAIFHVEVLFESEKPIELLKSEYKALKIGMNDDACLNNTFDAYIPAWIPLNVVSKYQSWLKSLSKPAPIKKKNEAKKPTVSAKDNKVVPARRVTGANGGLQNIVRGNPAVGRKKESARAVEKKPKRNNNK